MECSRIEFQGFIWNCWKESYIPASKAEQEEIEGFYEDLVKARQMEKAHFVIVMGDFSAKIEERKQGDMVYVGNFGLAERNVRGEILHTLFKKPKKRK